MLYRVMVDIAFKNEQDAKEIFDLIKNKKEKVKIISVEENPRTNYHKCFHDESPNKPCEIIEKLEFAEEKGKKGI